MTVKDLFFAFEATLLGSTTVLARTFWLILGYWLENYYNANWNQVSLTSCIGGLLGAILYISLNTDAKIHCKSAVRLFSVFFFYLKSIKNMFSRIFISDSKQNKKNKNTCIFERK